MSAAGHLGEKLSGYLDDELAPAERAAAEEHLRDCASCAQLLEELAAVDSASRALGVQAPEGYFDAFPARVRERLAARRPRRVPVWTWAAAAAVLLAVLTPLTLRDLRAPAAAPEERNAKLEQQPLSRAPEAPAVPVNATPAAPATTLTAEQMAQLRALGYTDGPSAAAEGKVREFRQKRDAAQDERLRERERDADAVASGADVAGGAAGGVVGGVAGGSPGPARRATDLKDGELKKEAFADKVSGDKLNQNAAHNTASAPATVPPAAAAEPEAQPQLAERADEYAAKGRRAEPPKQVRAGEKPAAPPPPPPPAAAAAPRDESPRAQASPAQPSPSESELPAAKSAGTPALTFSTGDAGFAEEFAGLASRPLRKAEDARAAARQWSELARRHPQAAGADEARVRAIEALATAWRLEHKAADRDRARKEAAAYLAADRPQKDRVRAILDQLAR